MLLWRLLIGYSSCIPFLLGLLEMANMKGQTPTFPHVFFKKAKNLAENWLDNIFNFVTA